MPVTTTTTIDDPVIRENKELYAFFTSPSPTKAQAKALDASYQKIEFDKEGWPSGIDSVSPLLLAVELKLNLHIQLCLNEFLHQKKMAYSKSNERERMFFEAQIFAIGQLRPDILSTIQKFDMPSKKKQQPEPMTVGDYAYIHYPELANFFSQPPSQANLQSLETHYYVEWDSAEPGGAYNSATLNIFILALALDKKQHAALILKQPEYMLLQNELGTESWLEYFKQQEYFAKMTSFSMKLERAPAIATNLRHFSIYKTERTSDKIEIESLMRPS